MSKTSVLWGRVALWGFQLKLCTPGTPCKNFPLSVVRLYHVKYWSFKHLKTLHLFSFCYQIQASKMFLQLCKLWTFAMPVNTRAMTSSTPVRGHLTSTSRLSIQSWRKFLEGGLRRFLQLPLQTKFRWLSLRSFCFSVQTRSICLQVLKTLVWEKKHIYRIVWHHDPKLTFLHSLIRPDPLSP
jgi:hypothetical protein